MRQGTLVKAYGLIFFGTVAVVTFFVIGSIFLRVINHHEYYWLPLVPIEVWSLWKVVPGMRRLWLADINTALESDTPNNADGGL